MPFKLLLSKTGKPAAQAINTVVAKNATVPSYTLAFELVCKQRENKKGKYYVPQIRHVEAKPEDVEVAEHLFAIVPQDQPPAPAEPQVDEPAI
jgi:hypothetical protein